MDALHMILLALIITGIHVVFLEGNVLSFVRVWSANRLDRYIGLKWSRYVQKPLWDCLPCMASVWGMLLSWSVDVLLLLAVCGLLAIIDKFLNYGQEI